MAGLKRQLAESATSFKSVFANPNLRRVELSATASSLGGWGYSIAVSVYAFQVGGATAVGLMWIVRTIPAALLSPLGGAVADRLPRRTVMIGSDTVRLAIMLVAALSIWQGWPSAVVYVAAALSPVVGAPFHAASAAFLPTLARTPGELTAANAVSGIIDSVGFFVGPAIAGVVLAGTNVATTVLVTAGGILLSLLSISRVSATVEAADETARAEEVEVAPSVVRRFASDVAAGFTTIASNSSLAVLLGIFAAAAALSGAIEVLIVDIAFRLLHVGNIGVGYLNSAFGIGALLGAVITLGIVGMRRLTVPFIVGALLCVAPALIAAAPNRTVAIAALVLLGLGNPLLDVPCFTLLQRAVPEALLARVFGVLQLIWNGAIGIGAIVAPVLLSGVGVRATLVIISLFVPVLVVILWRPLLRIDATAEVPAADRLELLRRTPIFAPLPGGTLESLSARLIPLEMPEGTVIIREGDEGDRFYLIAEGSVEISAAGAHVNTIGPGEPLGEIALLRAVPRTATCTALTPVKLFALSRDDFLAAVTSHAGSRHAAETTVASRMSGLQSAVGRLAVPRL